MKLLLVEDEKGWCRRFAKSCALENMMWTGVQMKTLNLRYVSSIFLMQIEDPASRRIAKEHF